MTSISSLRVGLPQDLRKESARLAVQQSVEVLCEKFGAEKGLPQLDPVKVTYTQKNSETLYLESAFWP